MFVKKTARGRNKRVEMWLASPLYETLDYYDACFVSPITGIPSLTCSTPPIFTVSFPQAWLCSFMVLAVAHGLAEIPRQGAAF